MFFSTRYVSLHVVGRSYPGYLVADIMASSSPSDRQARKKKEKDNTLGNSTLTPFIGAVSHIYR